MQTQPIVYCGIVLLHIFSNVVNVQFEYWNMVHVKKVLILLECLISCLKPENVEHDPGMYFLISQLHVGQK